MNRKKITILIILVLSVGAYLGYGYLYQEHRDIQSEAASMTITSSNLLALFQSDTTQEVFNKALVVNGVISNIEGNLVTLDGMVDCEFESLSEAFYLNERISVKGRCVGYDDLMETVKLDQCQIVK